MDSSSHVQEHIDTIVKHEHDFLSRRRPSERLGLPETDPNRLTCIGISNEQRALHLPIR
jgi:hypothetical protein